MNRRQKFIVERIKEQILEGLKEGKEKRIKEISDNINLFFGSVGLPKDITPKLVGIYLNKFLDIETERRGHDNFTYPVLTPEKIISLKLNE